MTLYLYDVLTQSLHAQVKAVGMDVHFPEDVDDWTDTLDARISPYKTQSLEQASHFAASVHKKFLLVNEETHRSWS